MASAPVTADYRTWADYLADLGKLDRASTTYGGRSWARAANVGEAQDIADRGWPAGMEKVRSISLPALNAVTPALVQDAGWGWDVTGASYDVGELLTGNPECWLSQSQMASKPCVTIAANVVSSSGVPAEMLELRGAAVVALTMALQSSGYAVRVLMVEGALEAYGESRSVYQRVCLTDDNGGPMDTDRILFALAHPASTRLLAYNNLDRLTGAHVGGWMPHDPPESIGWTADLYLPAVKLDDADWKNAESVTRWVADTYAKLAAGDRSAAKG